MSKKLMSSVISTFEAVGAASILVSAILATRSSKNFCSDSDAWDTNMSSKAASDAVTAEPATDESKFISSTSSSSPFLMTYDCLSTITADASSSSRFVMAFSSQSKAAFFTRMGGPFAFVVCSSTRWCTMSSSSDESSAENAMTAVGPFCDLGFACGLEFFLRLLLLDDDLSSAAAAFEAATGADARAPDLSGATLDFAFIFCPPGLREP
mmetsp:Transcript_5034/g.13040  ORF Transcript_5034/g.13040 Transcript_5034/m.13040 type:complete len:210 (+) Transcript_5034:395-1024(+)